jgi:diaminopimelate decarboxylase
MRSFHHSPATVRFWRRLVRQVLRAHPSPFYLFAVEPVREALGQLEAAASRLPVPVRHWLSCKTQPVRPLLRWWRQQGRPIEVVSEFELQAALGEGFPPDQVLVNGPAKHHWLPRYSVRGLRVNFDSNAELSALVSMARSNDWGVGVRCLTREDRDPEEPGRPTQFGLAPTEAVAALRRLRRAGVRLETVHFHLRTNVASPTTYARAMAHVAEVCRTARFQPAYLDCGGGWPPPRVRRRGGGFVDAGFTLTDWARTCQRALGAFPNLREFWLENGRFLTAGSGVLVTRVLESKIRGRERYLICDAGRTTQALVSQWEAHGLLTIPRRQGGGCLTTVCGPTCMAFDQLARATLPQALRPGDHLVWLEAGAYHIPWETRFSHGLAAVFWHQEGALTLARPRESFEEWWGQWSKVE